MMALGAINPPCVQDHSTLGQRALSSQVSKEEMIREDGFMTVGGGGVVPTLSQYFADYRGTWTRSSASPRPLTHQRPTCLDQKLPEKQGVPNSASSHPPGPGSQGLSRVPWEESQNEASSQTGSGVCAGGPGEEASSFPFADPSWE